MGMCLYVKGRPSPFATAERGNATIALIMYAPVGSPTVRTELFATVESGTAPTVMDAAVPLPLARTEIQQSVIQGYGTVIPDPQFADGGGRVIRYQIKLRF